MEDKTKDIMENERTPIKLSPEEFNKYSKNIKSIFLHIGLLATSFWGPVIFILLLVALYYLDILTASDKTINILVVSAVTLLVLIWTFIFRYIKRKAKEMYLDNIIIVNPDLAQSLKRKHRQNKTTFKWLCMATAVVFLIGLASIILVQGKYPDNIGYAMLGIIVMLLASCIPLFFAIYSYAPIYIYRDIDNNYNF